MTKAHTCAPLREGGGAKRRGEYFVPTIFALRGILPPAPPGHPPSQRGANHRGFIGKRGFSTALPLKMRIAGNLLRNGAKRGMMDAVSRIGRPPRLFTTCGRFVDRLCDSCGRVGDNSGACSQVRASPQDIHRFVNSGGLPYAQNNRDLRNSSTLSTSRIEKTGLMK